MRVKNRAAATTATKRTAKKKAPAPVALPLATPQPMTAIPATPAETLLALAQRLYDNPKYLEDVRLAAESPSGYVEAFAGELENRGIEEATPELPWIALTDGLARYGVLTFLDWKLGRTI